MSNAKQVKVWRKKKRGTEPPNHGTAHSYLAYGCRCSECTAANRRKYQKWEAANHERKLAQARSERSL